MQEVRVVIDTNVFISSFFGGKPKQVVDLWRKGWIELCLSREILEEYIEVTVRFGLKYEKEITELMNLFIRGFNTVWTFEPPHLKVEMKDFDDMKFLECAAACRSVYVITGDAEFRKIGSYGSVKILLPAEFLALSESR
jgi:uncharacterized protein